MAEEAAIARLEAVIARLEERIANLKELMVSGQNASKEAVAAALAAQQTAMAAALAAQQKLAEAQAVWSQTAVDKALATQQAVNAGQNEFRAMVTDQQATFIGRPQYEAEIRAVGVRIDDLGRSRDTAAGAHDSSQSARNLVISVVSIGIAIASMIFSAMKHI